jgi:16S rRNA C967 or C1407 C5-methylase (RsmB/RsmF family)
MPSTPDAKIPFREFHLYQLLEDYTLDNLPLDLAINRYFRAHPALGAKDRPYIADTAYALIRWQRLIDHFSPSTSWPDRAETFFSMDLEQLQHDETIPLSVRLSFPSFLFDLIIANHGIEKGSAICWASNFPAPTTVRANALKITREELINRWKEQYEVSPTLHSPYGIVFHKKLNFFQLPEFKEGLFEVQDEGSQLLGLLVDTKPGELVLDYCAGSGGKSLAFAPLMQGKGQIYLHDIRPWALQDARQRMARGGVQNYQLLQHDSPHLSKLKKKMDWVLIDAPCSGTGTLRRNPDMKWKFDDEVLQRLIGQQRMIFEKGLSFLKPGGKIIYATCSILKEENQSQVEHFQRVYGLEQENESFHSVPEIGGMDGFFGVVLKRN